MDMTAEQEAAIRDIASRYLDRRSRAGRTGAAVQRNNWSKRDAEINGALGDFRTTHGRYVRAKSGYEAAEQELETAEFGIAARLARLSELAPTPEEIERVAGDRAGIAKLFDTYLEMVGGG